MQNVRRVMSSPAVARNAIASLAAPVSYWATAPVRFTISFSSMNAREAPPRACVKSESRVWPVAPTFV